MQVGLDKVRYVHAFWSDTIANVFTTQDNLRLQGLFSGFIPNGFIPAWGCRAKWLREHIWQYPIYSSHTDSESIDLAIKVLFDHINQASTASKNATCSVVELCV